MNSTSVCTVASLSTIGHCFPATNLSSKEHGFPIPNVTSHCTEHDYTAEETVSSSPWDINHPVTAQDSTGHFFKLNSNTCVHLVCRNGQWLAYVMDEVGELWTREILPVVCNHDSSIDEIIQYLIQQPIRLGHRLIHILRAEKQGRARTVVFLGHVGLRGGGKRKPRPPARPGTGGNALQKTSSFQRITTMGIFKMGQEKQIDCIEDLVIAFNAARSKAEARTLAEWIRKITAVFETTPQNTLSFRGGRALIDYTKLSEIRPMSVEHVYVIKDYINSLWSRVRDGRVNDKNLIEALESVLMTVNVECFREDTSQLLDFSRFLKIKLDAKNNSFSSQSFAIQGKLLNILHRTLQFLAILDPGTWNPTQRGGLSQQFLDWSAEVMDNVRYYPVVFRTQLIRQSLEGLQSHLSANYYAEHRRKLFEIVKGGTALYGVARKAVLLDFDFELLETGVNAFQEGMKQRIVRERAWYSWILNANKLCFSAINDAKYFPSFCEHCTDKLTEITSKTRYDAEIKTMRFAAIDYYATLAKRSDDAAIRKHCALLLIDLAWSCDKKEKSPWVEDPDLATELLDQIALLFHETNDSVIKEDLRTAIEVLTTCPSKRDGSRKGVSFWLDGNKWQDKLTLVSDKLPRDERGDDYIFRQVRRQMDNLYSKFGRTLTVQEVTRIDLLCPREAGSHKIIRNETLKKIVKNFVDKATRSVTISVIRGPGGIGKTRLAAAAFDELSKMNEYAETFWIDARSKETLDDAFIRMSCCFGIKTKKKEYDEIIEEIHNCSKYRDILYVFDGAPDAATIKDYLPVNRGDVIVTTRNDEETEWKEIAIDLPPFEEKESLELAKSSVHLKERKTRRLDETLRESVPMYPSILAQLFAATDSEDFKHAEISRSIRDHTPNAHELTVLKELATRLRISEKQARGMIVVFNENIKQLMNESKEDGESALALLVDLAHLDPIAISVDWIHEWDEMDENPLKPLTRQRLSWLEKRAFIEWSKEPGLIYMQPETQLMIRRLLVQETTERNSVVIRLIDRITQFAPEYENKSELMAIWLNMLSQARSVLTYLDGTDEKCVESARELAEFMEKKCETVELRWESLTWARKALEVVSTFYQERDAAVAHCVERVAVALGKVSEHEEALVQYKRAKVLFTQLSLHKDAHRVDTSLLYEERNLSKSQSR